jgi:hypothetical protein
MFHSVTDRRLVIDWAGWGPAYLDLPLSQMETVIKLFVEKGIPHRRDHVVVRTIGPEIGIIHFEEGADVALAQELLDAEP